MSSRLVRRRERRVTVRRSADMLRRWPPSWLVTCEGCGQRWHWDSWWQAVRWAESVAAECCRSPLDLWNVRTTSSGAFPKARREKNKLRGARKVC